MEELGYVSNIDLLFDVTEPTIAVIAIPPTVCITLSWEYLNRNELD
jgi:hypothetical protein